MCALFILIASTCSCFPGTEVTDYSLQLGKDYEVDPLLDSLSVLEGNSVRARNLLTRSRRAFKRFHGHLFLKEKIPEEFDELVGLFNGEPDPMLEYRRSLTKTGSEVSMAMAMAHDAKVDWEKVSSSFPIDDAGQQVALKPFFKKAKKYSKLLVALTEVSGTQATGASAEAPSASATPSAVVP